MPVMPSVSPFCVVATGSTVVDQPYADLKAIKADVLARLNLREEYKQLGVRFSEIAARPGGWIECYARDRPDDDTPSAAVNIHTGVYVSDGGAGRIVMGFFDAALQFGSFGRFGEVLRHYAAKAGVEVGRLQTGRAGMILEEVYEYFDAGGELRYGVFRYRQANGKKEFRQYPHVNGEWKKSPSVRDGQPVPLMDGVEPLPYRLPELLDAPPSTPVVIVEGEKDVDRLMSLGILATTNHQGSNSTHATWPKFSEYFEGRTVVVVPDNDPTGRDHAHAVAGYLKPAAATVRFLSLPGLPHKGDVSDWLDQGGELAELLRLIDSAPEWSEEQQPDPRDPEDWAHVGDLESMCLNVPWVWEGWILGGALTLLAADPGVGKTRFAFDLFRRIANNLPWPDGKPMNVHPGSKFVVLAADNQHAEFPALCKDFNIPREQVRLTAKVKDMFGGTMLESKADLEHFEACLEALKPSLVFVDTIGNTSGHDHYSNEAAMKRYKPLQEIAKRTGTAIVCVIHTNAKGKAMGRRAEAQVRTVVQLSEPDPENDPHRLRLWVSKSFAVKPDPLGVTRGTNGNDYDTNPPDLPSDDDPKPKGKPKQKAPQGMSDLDQIKAWAVDVVTKAGGAIPSETIVAQAKALGVSYDLLHAAVPKGDRDIRRGPVGHHGPWHCILNPKPPGYQPERDVIPEPETPF